MRDNMLEGARQAIRLVVYFVIAMLIWPSLITYWAGKDESKPVKDMFMFVGALANVAYVVWLAWKLVIERILT